MKLALVVSGMILCACFVLSGVQPQAAILAFTALAVYAILSGMP